MSHRDGERIFGIETEFGTLVETDWGDPEAAVEAVKDHVFYELKLGAIDRHARDEVFEPAESGGFLMNGGRLYIDAVGSHLEYATAECRKVRDLVANDRAGQRTIVRALRETGLSDVVSVYNNSVDHFGGHTFGCHENYLVRMGEDFFSHRAQLLYAFLVTRQIYAGVGRVGGHFLAAGGRPHASEVAQNPIDFIWVSQVYNVYPDPDVRFQLSQRADHILKTIASRVRFNRAIINPKWEHFYAHEGMHRLHVLFGESNQCEYAFALKVGATSLVLRLIEDAAVPEDLQLAEPLIALRDVSRDPDYKWTVTMADGSLSTAVEVQRRYLELAERYRDFDSDTDWTLDNWARTLDSLASDPLSLADRLDWVNKLKVVEAYREDAGLAWDDDSLHSVDLEYHNIDPSRGLFYATDTVKVVSEPDIVEAQTEPPQDTRAKGRSERLKEVLRRANARPYVFDWSGVALDRNAYIEMPDPFETYSSADQK
ncbi:MAG: proteasome accessory factor PafA2 family protein [Armatimonadetes bacterium]|nr:proteasome accessory factor PafA2 family protein [Armatimonadota bacterium]